MSQPGTHFSSEFERAMASNRTSEAEMYLQAVSPKLPYIHEYATAFIQDIRSESLSEELAKSYPISPGAKAPKRYSGGE